MKNYLKGFLLLTATLCILLTSCEYDTIEPTPPPPVPPAGDTISYSQDIQPFFDAKCVSCHQGGTPPNLKPAVSYNQLVSGNYFIAGNPEASALYITCKTDPVMVPYTSAENLNLIYRWIYAGAKND